MDSFKTTDQLFGRIMEDFASFTQAQLIDEGTFYTKVKYILTLLGIMWYREAEAVLQIEHYKARLPEDFKLLDAAYSCQGDIIDTPQPDGLLLQQLSFDQWPNSDPDWHTQPCCDTNTCCPVGFTYDSKTGMCCITGSPNTPCVVPSQCGAPKETLFNRHVLTLVKRGNQMCQYHTPRLLKIGNVNTKRQCTSSCANVYSTESDTITLQNRHMYTNFKEGNVFIRYHAFPVDEETGLPLIPDNPIIERCIEMFIKAEIIRNLWTNGDADVQQQVRYYDDLSDKALAQAIYETKLPSFQTMVNAIRLKRKELNVYQLYPSQPSWPVSKRI